MITFVCGFIVGIIATCAVLYFAFRNPSNFLRW
jgi:hypothetical protein